MRRRALRALGIALAAALIGMGVAGLRARPGAASAPAANSDVLLAAGIALAVYVAGAAEETLPEA